MFDAKALALFQEVLKKTEARKLPWKPTSQPDEFSASLMDRFRLVIIGYTSVSDWGETEGPPKLTLNDEKGKMLVEITTNIDEVSAEDLKRLYVFARRTALNADEKIDELLNELMKDDQDMPF
jgi:hypothetical protein